MQNSVPSPACKHDRLLLIFPENPKPLRTAIGNRNLLHDFWNDQLAEFTRADSSETASSQSKIWPPVVHNFHLGNLELDSNCNVTPSTHDWLVLAGRFANISGWSCQFIIRSLRPGCQSFLIRSSERSSGEKLWIKVIWRRFRRLYLWLLFKFHCVDLIIKFCYCKYLLKSPKTTRSRTCKTASISIKRH